MQAPSKKLGELLVESGLITAAQLQDALRHQKFIGGRLGSNLVALGFVSEDVLMDFLSQQMGVPRLDINRLNVEPDVLRRVPRRLAEQLCILPVAIKEPKSLVLAMADPSDLNAIDSARFASGLTIEPVVVSFSAVKAAISEQYKKIETPTQRTHEVSSALPPGSALEVNFDFDPAPPLLQPPPKAETSRQYPVDPFFGESLSIPSPPAMPLGFGNDDPFDFSQQALLMDPALMEARPSSAPTPASGVPMVIHARKDPTPKLRSLESYQTRTLIMGLMKMLQRRGVFTEEEFQRYLFNAVESGELADESPVRSEAQERPL